MDTKILKKHVKLLMEINKKIRKFVTSWTHIGNGVVTCKHDNNFEFMIYVDTMRDMDETIGLVINCEEFFQNFEKEKKKEPVLTKKGIELYNKEGEKFLLFKKPILPDTMNIELQMKLLQVDYNQLIDDIAIDIADKKCVIYDIDGERQTMLNRAMFPQWTHHDKYTNDVFIHPFDIETDGFDCFFDIALKVHSNKINADFFFLYKASTVKMEINDDMIMDEDE